MKRIIVLLVVSAILVLALSAPAMAFTYPYPPGTAEEGEPVLDGQPLLSGTSEPGAEVTHCEPYFESEFGVEDAHGALLFPDEEHPRARQGPGLCTVPLNQP